MKTIMLFMRNVLFVIYGVLHPLIMSFIGMGLLGFYGDAHQMDFTRVGIILLLFSLVDMFIFVWLVDRNGRKNK